jgi:hypothetical protein
MFRFTYAQIKDAIDTTESMTQAAQKLRVSYDCFRRYAVKFNLWKPNTAGVGVWKSKTYKSPEELFVDGSSPCNSVLRRWFYKHSEYRCTLCDISAWMGKELTLEVDHIDGNRTNNTLSNLRWLCPNCHSQTSTWKGKNINNRAAKKN